jgi:hypothetical protein
MLILNVMPCDAPGPCLPTYTYLPYLPGRHVGRLLVGTYLGSKSEEASALGYQGSKWTSPDLGPASTGRLHRPSLKFLHANYLRLPRYLPALECLAGHLGRHLGTY